MKYLNPVQDVKFKKIVIFHAVRYMKYVRYRSLQSTVPLDQYQQIVY